jgi:hypothetical protein
MKKFAAILLVIIAIIGAAVFWLSSNIDGLIKSAIANYGSAMTQAKVSVDEVKISAATARARSATSSSAIRQASGQRMR